MFVELIKFKCYDCGARLADIEPTRSTLAIKCPRCNTMNVHSPVNPRLVVGGRLVDICRQVFGTAPVMA